MIGSGGHIETKSSPGKRRQRRLLAKLTAVAFFISLAFPIGASLRRDSAQLPKIWGILDVFFAFIFAACAITVAARFERAVDDQIRLVAYRAYRHIISVVLLVLVIFLAGLDGITWTVLLPGIAWRGWLLFYTLPPWLAAWREGSDQIPKSP